MIKIILGLIVSLFITTEGFGMSLFDIGKICLFSEVKGQVLLNGEPVKDAMVTQTYIWSHEPTIKVVKTDEQGYFKFDAVFTNSLAKFLPVEAVVPQEIKISYANKVYDGWITTKRSFDENSELDGKAIDLICELTGEDTTKEVGVRVVLGLCRWK